MPSSHHTSYIPIARNGQRMESVCDIHNMWMEVSICDAKLGREPGRQDFMCCPPSQLQEIAGQEKKQKLFKSEADTKTPSNTGCLIQSWMLHSALRRTVHPLDWHPPGKNHAGFSIYRKKLLCCSYQAGTSVWDQSYVLNENYQKGGQYSVSFWVKIYWKYPSWETNSDVGSYEGFICTVFPWEDPF